MQAGPDEQPRVIANLLSSVQNTHKRVYARYIGEAAHSPEGTIEDQRPNDKECEEGHGAKLDCWTELWPWTLSARRPK